MRLDCRQKERELTATRAELSETQKDFMCLAELLDGHDATECRMNLVRLKEQRDRLAEALERLMSYQPRSTVIAMNEHHVWRNAKEALQLLTIPTQTEQTKL